MGLTSIRNLKEAKNTSIGGVNRLYLLRYKDLLPLISGERYEVKDSYITDLYLKDGTIFTEVGLFKNAFDVQEQRVYSSFGTSFLRQSITINLLGFDDRYSTFMDVIRGQNLVVLIRGNNDKHFILGLKGNLWIKSFNKSIGKVSTDYCGVTIQFEAEDSLGITLVADDVVKLITTFPESSSFSFPYILPLIFG